jgi:hypothetical protein
MTTLPRELPPDSILPPHWPASAFIPARKDVARVPKILFRFLYVFKNFVRMESRNLKLRTSGIVGRWAIHPLGTHCITRRQQPNQTRNYNRCIIQAKWRVTNVKAGGTLNQGRIKKWASRAAARGENLYGALRRHCSNRKHGAGKLRFSTFVRIYPKIIHNLGRGLQRFSPAFS